MGFVGSFPESWVPHEAPCLSWRKIPIPSGASVCSISTGDCTRSLVFNDGRERLNTSLVNFETNCLNPKRAGDEAGMGTSADETTPLTSTSVSVWIELSVGGVPVDGVESWDLNDCLF